MTNNQEDKKAKKLTLSGAKLSLANYSKKVTTTKKTLGSSGAVVVEVKHGKVTKGGDLSLTKNSINKKNIHESSSDQENRRMAALQRSKIDNTQDKQIQISSLSKLVKINQRITSKENIDVSVKQVIEPSTERASISKKEHTKNSSDNTPLQLQKEKLQDEKVIPAKLKSIEPKKLKKSDIISMLEEDTSDVPLKIRSLASIKRARAKEKRQNEEIIATKVQKVYREIVLPEVITVSELSNRMSERVGDVTRELMKIGVMATATQSIDSDTAELIAVSLGHSVKRVKESDIEDILINKDQDDPKNLIARAPVVTVMGHVDHGKTSLLDALKSTNIVSSEAGGITQHIGAYSIITTFSNRAITFIDTPGHEAFTEMRTRGTQVTDIVVLVVAADDGIKAQTVEAISHAKAAGVPIIVAINKIDKPEADIERVKTELLVHELIPEDLGGDIITVNVSAKQKKHLDKLVEAILLVSEMQELRTNPNTSASGVVIESKIDQSSGIIVTVIVQRGTLKKGNIIIAGDAYGRVRKLCNDTGQVINEAGPSVAVELYGFNSTPAAGNVFNVTDTDKQARDIVEYRIRKARNLQVTASKTSLEDLFLRASGSNKVKEISIIIKGDVYGSIEAIVNSLNKITSDEVKLKILHSAVGSITESDVILATASKALILGFNVRSSTTVSILAENNKIDIKYYSVIYHLVDDIKSIISGMLSPIIREEYTGSVDIREIFNISKVGRVAGSYVTKGVIRRGSSTRLLRDNIVIHEGKLKILKRFKEDVKEVKEGFECGISFENYNNIRVGDSIEVFEIVKEKKKL